MLARTDTSKNPEFSLIMPCYNEEQVIGYTIPRLVQAFEQASHRLELVACDNGSGDRTGEIIEEFIDQGLPVVHHRVKVNRGYGYGVLESIPVCSAPWIGIIPADGQVDAEDVVRVFEALKRSNGHVLAKVRRRFRLEGPFRWIVSVCYNIFTWALWPGLGTIDVNGSPKLLHRDIIRLMQLESHDWLLDPEIMVKAHYMGVRVIEMNVFSRMREHGESHVRPTTIWVFLKTLLEFRFGNRLTLWRRNFEASGGLPDPVAMDGVSSTLPQRDKRS